MTKRDYTNNPYCIDLIKSVNDDLRKNHTHITWLTGKEMTKLIYDYYGGTKSMKWISEWNFEAMSDLTDHILEQKRRKDNSLWANLKNYGHKLKKLKT
mgnify:CR=1 FL=1